MARFIIRRLLLIPLALVVTMSLAYIYGHVVQWDYANRYPQLAQQLRRVDQRPESVWKAYRNYIQGVAHLDFGQLRNGDQISKVVGEAFGRSLVLLAMALTLSVPLGLGIGILGAAWRRLRPARWLTVMSTAGLAMPSFYIGSLLILISIAYALWRGGGVRPPFPLAGFGWDEHLVLPVIALMVRPTVQIAQVTGTLLTGELQKPYVAAARSLGHRRISVKRRLAFRNVLAPIMLTIAGSLRLLVTDLILVEWLFFWPGLGRFLASALIPSRQTNMASSPYILNPPFLAALLAAVTMVFLIADFIASVLVRMLDPRLRVAPAEEVSNV